MINRDIYFCLAITLAYCKFFMRHCICLPATLSVVYKNIIVNYAKNDLLNLFYKAIKSLCLIYNEISSQIALIKVITGVYVTKANLHGVVNNYAIFPAIRLTKCLCEPCIQIFSKTSPITL